MARTTKNTNNGRIHIKRTGRTVTRFVSASTLQAQAKGTLTGMEKCGITADVAERVASQVKTRGGKVAIKEATRETAAGKTYKLVAVATEAEARALAK